MYAVDLHAHTRFFHGRRRFGDRYDPYGVRLLAWAASRRGLDAVATTNHDYYTRFDHTFDVDLVPGIEISTTRGHLLVVGPDPPAETVAGALTPAEAVDLAHEHGCAAIVAHPFRQSSLVDCAAVPFDAIEINGTHPATREHVERIAAALDLPCVGGSDAHFPFEVGRAYTLLDVDELTQEMVVDAIRGGRVEVRVRTGRFDDALRSFYRRVHRRKHDRDPLQEAEASHRWRRLGDREGG